MGYAQRFDNRKMDETRPIEAKVGVIKNADGSALFKIGATEAYVAVYGPRQLFQKSKQNPQKGVLRVNYNMMPFSGSGDRVRPGGNRRSKEISMVIEKSFAPIIDLSEFPNAVLDVFIELPQTDAGTRCAAICAMSLALADAGIRMKDMVAAVAVGKVDDQVVVDLSYAEEAYEDGPVADIPVAFLPNVGKLSLLQMDGECSKEELIKALEMGKEACKKIYQIQKQALKARYGVQK